ncbi:Uncharacterised protein [Enterobacter hormaechei]|nr:Uncharacterised protein [Enterobacter hormaechei]
MMFTVLPGSALPLRVGVLSSVVSPLTTGPWYAPTLSVTSRSEAASGAFVSITIPKPPVGSLVRPTPSVTVAVKLWLPSASAVSGVKLQLPLLPTVAVPIRRPLS